MESLVFFLQFVYYALESFKFSVQFTDTQLVLLEMLLCSLVLSCDIGVVGLKDGVL